MSIKEIAKRANVSPATVSRVLNNPDYNCSSPEVRERIRKAAMELNYAPNEAARRLKQGKNEKTEKTYYINVLITRTDGANVDPFFDALLRVIETEIHRSNCILSNIWYRSIFSDDKRCARESIKTIVEQMQQEAVQKADGLIVIGKCNKEALLEMKQHYHSVVCVNRNATSGITDEVVCDGRKIAQMAVEYLIGLGHQKIGYVGACGTNARYQGYLQTLREHDIEVEPEFIMKTRQTEVEGFKMMERLLESEERPTAIYCANDISAVGMLKCMANNKKCGYTPSIIGNDDIEAAQDTKPMLTTVRLPRDEMGKFAMYLLLDHLRGGHRSAVKMELEGQLLIRNSCIRVNDSSWSDYCI